MKKVLIAAGHSDVDPGAIAPSATEAKLALELRDMVARELKVISDLIVLTDGKQGQNLPLRESIALAKSCDLAIEFHFNASGAVFAQGVESISKPDKKEIAQKLSASVSAVNGSRLRGDSGWIDQTRSARGKLGFIEAGGIIVEICFITNTLELQQYRASKERLAHVLALTVKEVMNDA